MKTKHAIMFRLSNKIVQVNFFDNTQIVLHSESRAVSYVNKRGEFESYNLSKALESTNTEMTKRLSYTRQILTHMLNQNKGGAPGTGSARRETGGETSPLGAYRANTAQS